MSAERLERTLLGLAQRHVPYWARIYNASDPKRVTRLARHLASYNLLVLMGDFPQTLRNLDTDQATHVQNWVDGYTQLYLLLTRTLFPSSMNVSAQYADNQWPVIIIITGDSTPVIEALAGFAAPYVSARQSAPQVSEMELLGLMEIILETLEASSLPRDAYKRLLNDGAALLKRLLNASIPQYAITEFDRQVFTDSQKIITIPPEPPPAPPTATLPRINTRGASRNTTPSPQPAFNLPPEPPTLPEEDSTKLNDQDTNVDIAALKPQQAAYEAPDTEKLNSTQTVVGSADTPTPDAKPAPPPPMVLPPRRDSGKSRRPPVPRLPDQED